MKKRIACIALVLLGLNVSARTYAAGPNPIQWKLTVSGSAKPVVKKGSAFTAEVHALIQPGWHLYALDQEPGGPVPTRVNVVAGHDFSLDGQVEARGKTKTLNDPNFNIETKFYEQSIDFTVPVRVMEDLPPAQQRLFVDVLYQACNDRMCLQPTAVHLVAPLAGSD